MIALNHTLDHPAMDDLIRASRNLVQDMRRLQLNYHIKSTKSSVRRNEALWETVENARKDKK